MKTKTTWLLMAMLSSTLLAAPAQARDEHHGPRWDRHRNYDYRHHGHRDHGWRHQGHHEPHHRVYVQPERHYYYEQRNYYGGYYDEGHHHHRGHHDHHDHDGYKILGGAILLNEILHH